MRVQIADIVIRFESELESDIGDLCSFFKYHIELSDQEPDCTVVLKRQVSFYMPKDAKMLWQSGKDCSTLPEERLGRRRVSIPSKFDSYGHATCYLSSGRGEYYYGLMHDRSWICYKPSEDKITYVLHHRPNRKTSSRLIESINPLSAMPLLIHVIASSHGRFITHGAAVELDGKAKLFLGKSGSGKTTISTDLARKKVAFMGDDIVLIYLKDGLPMVGALLLPAKLKISNTTEKTPVDVPEQMQAKYSLTAPLGAVYLVRQNGLPESTVEHRPSAELLLQLMEASNGMMMQFDPQQWLSAMYDISAQVPYFILNYGERSLIDTSILINN